MAGNVGRKAPEINNRGIYVYDESLWPLPRGKRSGLVDVGGVFGFIPLWIIGAAFDLVRSSVGRGNLVFRGFPPGRLTGHAGGVGIGCPERFL